MDWIEANGTSLRYELSGTGDKVLVLVHEMGGTLDSWDQVMPMLSPGRRVLRHDWRGAGMSEKLRAPPTFQPPNRLRLLRPPSQAARASTTSYSAIAR